MHTNKRICMLNNPKVPISIINTRVKACLATKTLTVTSQILTTKNNNTIKMVNIIIQMLSTCNSHPKKVCLEKGNPFLKLKAKTTSTNQ